MVETLDLDDQWSLKEALERRRPSSATWRVCLDAATMYSAALGRQRRAKSRRLSRVSQAPTEPYRHRSRRQAGEHWLRRFWRLDRR